MYFSVVLKLILVLADGLLCTTVEASLLKETVQDESEDPFVFETYSLPGENGTMNTRYMPSIGNGHLATNIYTDTIYMNGFYNGKTGWSYRARIQALHASRMRVQGDREEDHTRTYRMDIRRGIYEEAINTSQAAITYHTYAHHFYTRLLLTEVAIHRQGGHTGDVILVRDQLSGPNSTDLDLDAPANYLEGACGSGQIKCWSQSGRIKEAETESSGRTPVYLYWTEMPDNLTLPSGTVSNNWTFIMAMDINRALAKLDFDDAVLVLNTEELYDRHVANWAEVWDKGYLDVEATDLNLQKVIYASFYYLYSNLPSHSTNSPANQFYGLSPGGLSNGKNGSDYYGHVFWDMETWMYPPVLLFRPDLARDMLSYRINGMDPAFERAAQWEHQGTRFPWESAYSGVEVTPDICPKCRENQQHITGDIAFAARQYVSATRDTDFLTQPQVASNNYTGFQFIREMARYWYSRPSYNISKAKYEIKGVMAPDEHAEEVDNSITTNVVASLAVHFARYAACLAAEDTEAMVPDRWLNVAENLYFPFNRVKRYHEEYEGYDWELEHNVSDPRGVKQADVTLMGFPFLWQMPEDIRKNDLEHYESRTNAAGPAMTWGIHTIGWLDYNDVNKAAALFNRSYQTYVLQPFKIWTEAYEGLGAVNFITGQGGFLQALISGYAGLRLHVEELYFRRHVMPQGISQMTLKNLAYLGSRLNITFLHDTVEVHALELSQNFPLEIYLVADGTTHDLYENGVVYLSNQDFMIYTTTASECELPRDMINVDYGDIDPPSTTSQPSLSNKLTVPMATMTALACMKLIL